MYDLYQRSGGLFVSIQSPHLHDLSTTILVLLLPVDAAKPSIGRINPVVMVQDHEYVLMTQTMAAVPKQILQNPIGTLAHESDRIRAAIDEMFFGF